LPALTHNFKPTAISGCGILSFLLKLNPLSALPLNTLCLLLDTLRFIKLSLRPRSALAAENLFRRKQLALYLERMAKPQRAKDAARLTLVLLSRLFAWRQVLTIVKPDTFIRWHRQGIRLFWRWKSKRRGRPRIPPEVQQLIAEMAQRNPTWGEERIAAEFLLKLGIRVSPRTVRRYMPDDTGSQRGPSSQRWMTFVRNHAQGILACDFFVAITATFRVFYVFVVLEVGTRRIAHFNVTAHPTADWTLQQFREVITGEAPYRFVVHDRDSIYSPELDSALKSMGMRVLKTPFRAPQANAFCERLVGTIRRECLNFLIPLNERHLRRILKEWGAHYNRGRPHSSLGPGIPDPPVDLRLKRSSGHRIPGDHVVVARSILAGLHHEYRLERIAA
jgi:transposase InsO family protein